MLFLSTVRLWGWAENEPEVKRAIEEGPEAFVDVAKSSLDPYLQGVAHRNSVWSQLKFSEWKKKSSGSPPGQGRGMTQVY